MPEPKTRPHYAGHRDRLRERFLAAGAGALADYELLEMLLFLSRPRGDVKPLAKALLARFGTFADVVAAAPQDLLEVPEVGARTVAALKTVQASALRMMSERLMNRPVISSWDQLIAYCRAAMGFAKVEQFRILFLDKKNCLIADEVQQQGTVDHTPVYPREVVKRALELGASAIIMVHNHPSGDTQPSKADIQMTKEIQLASAPLGIALHDHVVVGRGGHTSFRAQGLI